MNSKIKKNNKNYFLERGEVLKGSVLLRKKNKNFKDRTTYMIENMHLNKTYQLAQKEKKQKNILNQFKEKFKLYRKNWTEQPKSSINNSYLGKDFKKNNISPLCLDIEVASICDLACPFCFREYIATPDKIIDEKFCFNLIEQAASMGIPSIKFNWRGEPLLHPKLPEFINFAKKKGILETIINTNATQLDSKMAGKLIKSGLDYIIYSFDGGTKKTYEKMRPGRFKENSFDKVYENIKNFKKIRDELGCKFPFTRIQMILMEETINEVDNFFELFSECVDDLGVIPYSERGGKVSDLTKEERQKYKEILIKHNLAEGTHYMRDVFGNISVAKGRLPCEQPFQRLLVTYEGRVAMCCEDWGAKHPIGYAHVKSLKNNRDYEDVMKKAKTKKKRFRTFV